MEGSAMPDDVMHAHEFLPMIGKAESCVSTSIHHPVPFRYVWHHVLPQVCGGKSVSGNLISVCDNCHLAIHALMYMLAQNNGEFTTHHGTTAQRAWAKAGYKLAVAAGTVEKLPNEGGSVLS
jgi:hypothetical protein